MINEQARQRVKAVLAAYAPAGKMPWLEQAALARDLVDAVFGDPPTAGLPPKEGPEFDKIASAINSYIPKGEEYNAERFQLHRWLSAAGEALHARSQVEAVRDQLDELSNRCMSGTVGRTADAWREAQNAPSYRKLAASDDAALDKLSRDMRLEIARAFGWRTDFGGVEQAPPLSQVLAEIRRLEEVSKANAAELASKAANAEKIVNLARTDARDWFNTGLMAGESGDIAGHGDLAAPGGHDRAVDAMFGPMWDGHLKQFGTDSILHPERRVPLRSPVDMQGRPLDSASDRVRAPVKYDASAPRELPTPGTGAVWMHTTNPYVVTTKDAEGRTLVAVEAVMGSALLQQGERGDRWEIEACRLKRELDALRGKPDVAEVNARDNVGSLLGIGPKPKWASVLASIHDIQGGLTQIRKSLDEHHRTVNGIVNAAEVVDKNARTLSGVTFTAKLWGAVQNETTLNHGVNLARAHLSGGDSEPRPGTCAKIARALLELVDGVDVPKVPPANETWVYAELVHMKAGRQLVCVKLPANCLVIDPQWPHGQRAVMNLGAFRDGPPTRLDKAARAFAQVMGPASDPQWPVTDADRTKARAGLQLAALELAIWLLLQTAPRYDAIMRRDDDYTSAVETLQRFQRRAAEDAGERVLG